MQKKSEKFDLVFFSCFILFLLTPMVNNKMQNAKKVKYSLLFVSGKKEIYPMNCVHVLTVIVSA